MSRYLRRARLDSAPEQWSQGVRMTKLRSQEWRRHTLTMGTAVLALLVATSGAHANGWMILDEAIAGLLAVLALSLAMAACLVALASASFLDEAYAYRSGAGLPWRAARMSSFWGNLAALIASTVAVLLATAVVWDLPEDRWAALALGMGVALAVEVPIVVRLNWGVAQRTRMVLVVVVTNLVTCFLAAPVVVSVHSVARAHAEARIDRGAEGRLLRAAEAGSVAQVKRLLGGELTPTPGNTRGTSMASPPCTRRPRLGTPRSCVCCWRQARKLTPRETTA